MLAAAAYLLSASPLPGFNDCFFESTARAAGGRQRERHEEVAAPMRVMQHNREGYSELHYSP